MWYRELFKRGVEKVVIYQNGLVILHYEDGPRATTLDKIEQAKKTPLDRLSELLGKKTADYVFKMFTKDKSWQDLSSKQKKLYLAALNNLADLAERDTKAARDLIGRGKEAIIAAVKRRRK